ncbi:MAG: hypothetical protein ABIJ95_07090 [Pseudomonadota bacterium]
MKIKTEIEVDWISDDDGETTDQSLDQIMKDAIVKRVSDIIFKSVSDGLKESIGNEAATRVRERLDSVFDGFFDRQIVITDRFGDVKERHENVIDLIKAKLDGFLDDKVDKDGKPYGGCSYGKGQTRVEYIITTRVNEAVAAFTDGLVKQFNAELKARLDAQMQRKVSSALIAKIDLGELLATMEAK